MGLHVKVVQVEDIWPHPTTGFSSRNSCHCGPSEAAIDRNPPAVGNLHPVTLALAGNEMGADDLPG